MADNDDWGWWAGRDEYLFDVGPCKTKGDAIKEALGQGSYEEVETKDGWRRLVCFAECRGLHYDCDECGTVPEACQECKDYLGPEESGGIFAASRNAGSQLFQYEDET